MALCFCPLRCYCDHALRFIALRDTVYNGSTLYIDFDSQRIIRQFLGRGEYYRDILQAKNDTSLNKTSLFFTTVGPANLALCTTSTSSIPLEPAKSNCIVQRACSAIYTLSFWALLPSWSDIQGDGSFTLINIGPLSIRFVKSVDIGCGAENSTYSLYANVTDGSTTCTWDIGNFTELVGVWAHYVISVSSSQNSVSVYFNGKAGFANRLNCINEDNSVSEFVIGGGMALLCFDEISLWRKTWEAPAVEQLFNAIDISGKSDFDYIYSSSTS